MNVKSEIPELDDAKFVIFIFYVIISAICGVKPSVIKIKVS